MGITEKKYFFLSSLLFTIRFPMVSLEFFSDIILPVALWSGVDSASKRNEFQVYFLGVKAAGA